MKTYRLFRIISIGSLVVASTLGLSACNSKPDQSREAQAAVSANPVDTNKALPQAHPNRAAMKAPAQPQLNRGKVKEVLQSGGYSYLKVDISGKDYWLATSMGTFKKGDTVLWKDYAVMKDFKSKSLNRSFDQILFVDRVLSSTDMASNRHHGVVLETLQAAGYSYIHVQENGNSIWLAAPVTALEKGQKISWNSGAPMRNFSSKSLNRTFDEIYFVSKVSI